MRVFLVSHGSYSDYRIVAVFSSREKAEEFVKSSVARDRISYSEDGKVRTREKEYGVDEWDIDTPPSEDEQGCWVVDIDDAGRLRETLWAFGIPIRAAHESRETFAPIESARRFVGYGPTIEHARRSAEEFRRVTLTEPAAVQNTTT